MCALRARITKHFAYQPVDSHQGDIIQLSQIKSDTPTRNKERIALLLDQVQKQSQAMPDILDGYESHYAAFKSQSPLVEIPLLTRLRTTIDFLQCSKFSASPYQCFDLKVDIDEHHREVPVFYIKKRIKPAVFERESLYDFVALIKQPNFDREAAKNLLQRQGFFLTQDKRIADKILDSMVGYLTSKKYLKAQKIQDLKPSILNECNAQLNKIIDRTIEKPSSIQLLNFKAKSLLQKKLSYAATITYFLPFIGFPVEGLTEAQAREIEALLETLSEQAIQDTFDTIAKQDSALNVNKEASKFLKVLAEGIHKITGGDGARIQQAIVHAERYHTAELNANRCLVSETKIIVNEDLDGPKADFCVEYPLNIKLTSSLKDEYFKIHSLPPEWFKVLPVYVQDWLEKAVPKTRKGDWSYFQSLHFPSTIQNLPGMKNVRDCYSALAIDADTYKIYSSSTKGGTLTPNELNQKTDKTRITYLNVEQLLNHLAREGKKEFYSFWGKKDELSFYNAEGAIEHVKPVIFIHSLLSRIKGLGNARGVDNYMIATQDAAVDIISSRSEFKDFDVIRGTDPANGFQGLSYYSEYWEHTIQLFGKAEKLLYALGLHESKQWDQRWWDQVISALDNGNPDLLLEQVILNKQNSLAYLAHLSKEQKECVTKMIFAIKCLRELRTIDWTTENDNRNYRAYKSTYQGVLVEAMKGLIYSSCKSGKDRTGKDAKYRKAANIYFSQFGCLPLYNDNGVARDYFIDIFEELTHSKIFDVSAGRNSPGADGIKERQEQTSVLKAIKVGKLIQLALSAIGFAAGIGLCFIAPLLGAGIICGSLGMATLGLQSFSKKPINKRSQLFILTSIAGVAAVLAGVGIVATTVATGGIGLVAGVCFLSFVASSIAFAGATLAYGKWAKLRRGVTDEDITARSKKEYRVSLEQSNLNKPHLLPLKTKGNNLKAELSRLETTSLPIKEVYNNWKLQCSASLVRNEVLSQEWLAMDRFIDSKPKNKDDFERASSIFSELMIHVQRYGKEKEITHFQNFDCYLKKAASQCNKAGKPLRYRIDLGFLKSTKGNQGIKLSEAGPSQNYGSINRKVSYRSLK